MRRPRVLLVTTNLSGPGGSAAGAAGNAWRLVCESLSEDVDGLVLTPAADGLPDRELLGGIEVRRIRPVRPPESLQDAVRGRHAARAAAMSMALVAATRRALAVERYDLVHAFWAVPAGLAATWPRLAAPTLLSCPGSDLHSLADHAVAGRLVRRVVRKVDLVAANAAEGAARALELGAKNATTVPVCFDPDVFRAAPAAPAEPVIAYTSRMTASKGVFVLAEALERLADRLPGLRFVACGTGPDERAFRDRVERALGDRATFLGAVPPARVADVLGSARVAVLPSLGEGMSASAVEALATGRPVVTTDTGDHVDLVRAGGGRVVPIGDAGALADALGAELTTDRDPAVLRSLAAPFTPGRVAERVLELYDTLLTGPPGRSYDAATPTDQMIHRPTLIGGEQR